MSPAERRAADLFETPRRDIPPAAVAYMQRMCARYAMCAEVVITAYAHHAQIAEGLSCDNDMYLVTDAVRQEYSAATAGL